MRNLLDYLVILGFVVNYLLIGMNYHVKFLGVVAVISAISILGRAFKLDEKLEHE